MKILWVTNSIFPDLANALGHSPNVFGGWQFGLANGLSKQDNIELTIVCAKKLPYARKTINKINYYIINTKKNTTKYDVNLENKWKKIINIAKPDLVHIHGSEHAHGLSLVKSHPNLNYVLSIQGLISVYSRYYYGGINFSDLLRSITLRDLLKNDSIISGKTKFIKRGEEVEKKYFNLINNFIGRTEWDYSHTKNLNPNSDYHFNNESLRESFYNSKKWDYSNIDKYSIFLSQSSYPIKGMHQVIKAASLLINEFPKIKIKFAGSDILKNNSPIKRQGYGKYLKKLVTMYSLEKNIEYLGVLSEEDMVKEYLKCHTFICPSSIENSPNSLGEAQILGVPTIGTFVGGANNMITHEKDGILYRFEEVEMLAVYLRRIFTDEEFIQKITKNGVITAEKRHNKIVNLNQLIGIYNSIIN